MKTTASLVGLLGLLCAGCSSALVAAESQVQTSAARSTRLYVQTSPPGAGVTLEGKAPGEQQRGQSPHLFVVPPGVRKVVVHVELDGHYPKRQEIEVRGGWIKRAELDLQERPKEDASGSEADRQPGGTGEIPGTGLREGQVPAGAVRLSHVDDSAENKRSIGGSGHAVRFDRPAEADHVVAVQIHGSRYGYPQPPEEDFHVYLLDKDRKVIKDLPFAYGMIDRGPQRWYTLKMPAVKVPEQFHVALSFNPHQTKGVYVGIDENVKESHSYVGLPDRGFEKVSEAYDWMVRAYVMADPFGDESAAPKVETPEGPVRLSHVDDTAEGKRSIGGSGHAVAFERPAGAGPVTAVHVYASRYGLTQPPDEDFHVYLLDRDQKVIRALPYPYATIQRDPERWYTLKVPAIEVPERFYVALAFNPHQTKGIYLGMDKDVSQSHSHVGLPSSGFQKVTETYDWMVRVDLGPPAPATDAANVKPDPAASHAPAPQDPLRRWVVTGTVTDEKGQPLEGAEVRASCGMGTLMPTGSTTTDAAGRYTLRFGPGMHMAGSEKAEVPVNLQFATISVSREGHTEKNLHRQGGLMMANRMPEKGQTWGAKPEEIVLPDKPFQLDFVMDPAAVLDVQLLDRDGAPIAEHSLWIKGKQLPPSCSVLRSGKTDREGRCRFQSVPRRYSWWLAVPNPRGRGDVRTPPFALPEAGQYRAELRLDRDSPTGVDLLEIASVTDAAGREIRETIVGDDPFARPPVGPQLQAKGREILEKMAEVNRYWLGPPPPEVRSYEYVFRFADDTSRKYEVGEGKPAGRAVRQGIAYSSVLHHLTANPEDASFRQVEINHEQITLVYTLRNQARVSAGNGVLGTYHGYFSTSIRDGRLIIDPARFTLREHTTDGLHEIFSQYANLGEGRYVPLAIRIDKGMKLDWQFRLYEPGLWLFDAGYRQGDDGQREPVASIDGVKINGQDAKTIREVEGVEPPAAEATGSAQESLRLEHVAVSYAGIGRDYARAIARTVAAARAIAAEQFGFDMPETITVVVKREPAGATSLFTDGRDRMFLTVRSQDDLCKPSTSGVYHIYGLCHEVGHLAMYRLIRDHRWKTTAAAEGWAHYLGSRIVDGVYAREGEDLWPDRYEYIEDGTQRLDRQLAAAEAGPVVQGAGLWRELAAVVGDRGVAPIFAAWGKASVDPADPGKALGEVLLATNAAKQLPAWWEKAKGTLLLARPKSPFAAQRAAQDRLLGQPRELAHDDDRPAGKRSIAGSGHGVRFGAPGGSWYLTSVRVYGSRYGRASAPDEDFHVWVADGDFRQIADFPFPYRRFPFAEPGWVALDVEPMEIPAEFTVGVGFNPTATKGVYVHYDGSGSGNSLVGLPGGKARPFGEGDWMIRATLDQLKGADALKSQP